MGDFDSRMKALFERRIAALLAAAQGMKVVEIEALGLGGIADALRQRDELLAALTLLLAATTNTPPLAADSRDSFERDGRAVLAARQAIERARPG